MFGLGILVGAVGALIVWDLLALGARALMRKHAPRELIQAKYSAYQKELNRYLEKRLAELRRHVR